MNNTCNEVAFIYKSWFDIFIINIIARLMYMCSFYLLPYISKQSTRKNIITTTSEDNQTDDGDNDDDDAIMAIITVTS